MTKSVNIQQFNFYDDIPSIDKTDYYYLEGLIETVSKTLHVNEIETKRYPNKKLDRNNQIIRWYFWGLGVMRIEELMYLSEIKDPITTKPISIILDRFLKSIPKEDRAIFEEKRKVNMETPYGEHKHLRKIYKNKILEKQHR